MRGKNMSKIGIEQFLRENGEAHSDGFIRYWRKNVLGWQNAQILTNLYNEFIEADEAVSVKWIERMEKTNKVPIDLKRRWILATLLNIPPAYFGLELEKILKPEELLVYAPPRSGSINLLEYQESARFFWRSINTKNPAKIIEAVSRINTLQDALLYGKSQQHQQVSQLLCTYLISCGNVHRYQGYFKYALEYLHKALLLTKERNFDHLYTKTLYMIGFTLFNRWSQNTTNRDDLLNAIHYLSAAQERLAHTDCALEGAILSDLGRALACNRQDDQDKSTAMDILDRAEKVVGRDYSEEFLRVDEEWYHIDRAEALLAIGWPGSTLETVESFVKGSPGERQRYLYTDLIVAEAHIAKGWVEVGVAYLEEALESLNETSSRRHLNRIIRIYGTLRTKHKGNPEVARLGVKLLQTQHPELFKA
jgi:hypothetical protein